MRKGRFSRATTGTARGVTLSHANLVNFSYVSALTGAVGTLVSGRAAASGQPAAFAVSPLFHISGFGPVFCNAPMFGSKLVFPGPGGYDERGQLALTQKHAITSWSAVPTVFLRVLNASFFDEYDTSSVVNVGVGGSSVSPELLTLLQKRLPQARITNGYGMTESTGMGTFLTDDDLVSQAGSVGRVVPGIEAQVRNDDGKVLPEGEVGEIFLRGAGVFSGYWGDPAATSAAIDNEGWYGTGDFGRITGEILHLRSRMRDLILHGGENVYPIEVENRLAAHPAVAEVAVIGVPDPVMGQEVVAVLVLQPGLESPSLEELRAFAGLELAAFKLPTRLLVRDQLPYSATGKLLKRVLEDELSGVR